MGPRGDPIRLGGITAVCIRCGDDFGPGGDDDMLN